MTSPVAVIAAHPDDEVLGCGGTLARMSNEGRKVHILLLADGEGSRSGLFNSRAHNEALVARNAAALKACKILGASSVEVLGLPDNKMDTLVLLDVVKSVEAFISRYQPSTVFTHFPGDVNIDHRIAHDAVIAACRPLPDYVVDELFFFEIPSSTEWRPAGSTAAFFPNWFFDISATLGRKLDALEAYSSEIREFPHPRSLKAVASLATWRGASVGVTAAEAFILGRKLSRKN
jgi:LmbE family N-acetylglucosaminyl deacetylase